MVMTMNLASAYQTCQRLYEQSLYRSCLDWLTIFQATLPTNNQEFENHHTDLNIELSYRYRGWVLKGECSFQLKEYNRAIDYYQLALDSLPPSSSTTTTSSPYGQPSTSSHHLRIARRRAGLLEKLAACWYQLEIFDRVIVELERIPADLLPFSGKWLLCRAYRHVSPSRAYQLGLQCLRENPTALEIIDLLVEFDEADLLDFDQTKIQMDSWLRTYLEFKWRASRLKYPEAHQHLTDLKRLIPANSKWYAEESMVHYRIGDYPRAIELYKNVTRSEPWESRYLGSQFNMLAYLDRGEEIESLVSRYTGGGTPRTPHCLLGLAQLWSLKGELAGGLLLLDKGQELDRFNVDLIITRGQLLYKQGQFQESLREFQLALGFQKCFMVYEGLVYAAIKAQEFRLAKVVATHAIQNLPHHHPSLILMGLVHFFSPCESLMVDQDNLTLANRYFHKAQTCSPTAPEPIIWLAAVARKMRDYSTAKKLLLDGTKLTSPPSPLLYTQLGYLHLLTRHYTEGLEWFQRALSLQPTLRLAKSGRDHARHHLHPTTTTSSTTATTHDHTPTNPSPLLDPTPPQFDPDLTLNPLLHPFLLPH